MDEEPKTYSNPINYKRPATFANFEIKRIAEGLIVATILAIIILSIRFTWQFKVILIFLDYLGILALFCHGINGDRVSVFVLTVIFHLIRAKKYEFKKVGIEDVKALEDRDTSGGRRETNFERTLAKFKEQIGK